MDSSQLEIIISAVNNASRQLAEVDASLKSLGATAGASNLETVSLGQRITTLGETAGRVGRTMTLGLTAPIVGVAVASAKMAVDFQQQMTYIRTDAGDTTDSIAKLSNQVLALAKTSQFGPDQLAQGLYHLASLGLRGAQAMQALNTAQQMASVGGADLESTASALGAALVTGIKGVQNYTQAAGVLDATIGAGNMRMQDLVNALGTGVLPVFKNAGLSVTDFGAALATLTDNGMHADEAATRLRMTIALMIAPSGKARDALAAIGMTSNQLGLDMRTKGLIPAMEDLRQHLLATYGTTTEGKVKFAQALTEIFGGGRSSAAIQTLMDQLDRVQTKYNQISAQSGEFADKVAEQQQTASFKIHAAWSSIQADLIQMGGNILPALASAFSHIVNAVTDVYNWFERLSPSNKKMIETFLGVIAVVGPTLVIFSKVTKSIKDIHDSFDALGKLLGGGASLGGGMVLGLMAFVTIAVLIITHWNTVKQWFRDFWGWIKTGFDDVVNWLKTNWVAIMVTILAGPVGLAVLEIVKHWDTIRSALADVVEKIKRDAPEWGHDIIRALAYGLTYAVLTILKFDSIILSAIKRGIDAVKRNAPQWGRDVVNAIKKGLLALANYDLSSLINWGMSIINAGKKAITFGKSVISSIVNGFKTMVTTLVKWGHDVITFVGQGLSSAIKSVPRWGMAIINGIVSGLKSTVKAIINFFTSLPKMIASWVHQSGDSIASTTVSGASDHFKNVGNMRRLGQTILKGIGIAILAILGAVLLIAVSIGIAIINGVVSGVRRALGGIVTAMSWIRNTVINFFKGAGSWLYDVGRRIIQGLINGIRGAVGGVGNAIGGIGSDIAGGVKSALHAIHVPGFATGVANFSGGLAVVGERGPELVDLPRGSSVYPNSVYNQQRSQSVTIGQIVLADKSAVTEFFRKLDQDNLLYMKGLSPARGL